jgi:hypothetical protein
MEINIRADFRDIVFKLNKLPNDIQQRVIPAAVNKVAAKASTEMTRSIAAEFNLKSSEIRGKLKLRRAQRNVAKWFATLEPVATSRRGGSLNVIRFMEKTVSLAEAKRRRKSGTQNQLRFQILKKGGKKTITGAFIGNNGRTVFVRTGKERLPIRAVQTIGIGQMFNTNRVKSRVLDRINTELPIEMDRAINAALNGVFR